MQSARTADRRGAARHSEGTARWWQRRHGDPVLVSWRVARRLGRRFRAIEHEVAAERAAAGLAKLNELSSAGTRVLAINGAPARARSGRVQATLVTAAGTRLVLRDVAVEQLEAVRARVEQEPLEIGGGAMPGERVVVVLSGRRGTCHLSGSRLEVIARSAP